MIRHDPGPCPICDAAHTACTTSSGPVLVRQLPARDGAAATTVVTGPAAGPLVAEQVQTTLPPGAVTTGTYRRPKK